MAFFAVGRELAIGLIGDLPGREAGAAIHLDGFVRTEMHDPACRCIDLFTGLLRQRLEIIGGIVTQGLTHGASFDRKRCLMQRIRSDYRTWRKVMPCRFGPLPVRAAGSVPGRRAGDKRLCSSALTGINRAYEPASDSLPPFAMLTAAPAIRRWLGAASLGLLLALPAGCMPGQRLAGLDSLALSEMAPDHGGETWLALPMDRWRGSRDGLGKPRAVIACLADDCRNRLAAAVFELEGEAARLAERDLRRSTGAAALSRKPHQQRFRRCRDQCRPP